MEPPGDPQATSPLEPLEPMPVAAAPPTQLGFPLRRETTTFDSALAYASEVWKKDLGVWVLAMLIAMMFLGGIPIALRIVAMSLGLPLEADDLSPAAVGIEIVLYIVQVLIQGVAILGMYAMAFRGLHGHPASINALFSQIRKVLKYVLQVLAIYMPLFFFVIVVVLVVALVLVGTVNFDGKANDEFIKALPALGITMLVTAPLYIYFMLGVLFAPAELALNDKAGPIQAIFTSWRVAHGKRWLILGASIVAGMISVLSMMLCFIPFLFGGPLALLFMSALYLGLRKDAQFPEPNTTSVLGGVRRRQ